MAASVYSEQTDEIPPNLTFPQDMHFANAKLDRAVDGTQSQIPTLSKLKYICNLIIP